MFQFEKNCHFQFRIFSYSNIKKHDKIENLPIIPSFSNDKFYIVCTTSQPKNRQY